jgi:hypothetical protein
MSENEESPSGCLRPMEQIQGIVTALAQALDVRKLGFFLVGMFGLAIVLLLFVLAVMALLWLTAQAGSKLQSDEGWTIAKFLLKMAWWVGVALAVGIFGEIAGGVARMAHLESQGGKGGIREVLAFRKRRKRSLFGGILLTAAALWIASYLVNGLVGLINCIPAVGSFVGALLFLPQFVFNLVVFLALMTIILVPCVIAVEDIDVVQALTRVIGCYRRHVRELIVQVGVTQFFGTIVMGVLGIILIGALLPTLKTNGPSFARAYMERATPSLPRFDSPGGDSRSPFSSDRDSSRHKHGEEERSGSSFLEWLRLFFLTLVVLAWLSYPVVFWICSFTQLYGRLSPSFATGASPPPIPPAPPVSLHR